MTAIGLIVTIFIAIQTWCALAHLVVLRGKDQTAWLNTRKSVCISEDDGSALVWNSNLVWQYSRYAYSDRSDDSSFSSSKPYYAKNIDCSFATLGGCTSKWKWNNWSFTRSPDIPMGPVLDKRWEEFEENDNFNDLQAYNYKGEMRRSGGGIVVSVRGMRDAHFLLCLGPHTTSLCYWIIIGGWKNTKSAIRKCPNGVPVPPDIPDSSSECYERKVIIDHVPLSVTEWNTFLFTWNATAQNISVYDSRSLILTYVDPIVHPVTYSNFNILYRSAVPMLFRFHKYAFFHTTTPGSVLISPIYNPSTQNLCVQMGIGLCATCRAKIQWVSVERENEPAVLKIVQAPATSSIYGLPAWQYVTINESIWNNGNVPIKIQVVPILDEGYEEPMWGLANIRQCPESDTQRYGSIGATRDWVSGAYAWPNITCQKLSYDKNEVVSAIPDAKLGVNLSNPDCPPGKVGPYCCITCASLDNDAHCQGTVICEKAGCSCPPGYVGANCENRCKENKYGHDCEQPCGHCYNAPCDFQTGKCPHGCDPSEKHYVPPYCEIEIKPLPMPNIDFVDETSVSVSLEVKEEYKVADSRYRFNFREKKHLTEQQYRLIYPNSTIMESTIRGLQPGTSYSVNCELYVGYDYRVIQSEWRNFATNCSVFSDYQMTATETTLTIRKQYEPTEPFPCPGNWYILVVHVADTRELIKNETLNQIPRLIRDLMPYTSYQVTVGRSDRIFFNNRISTLEGAPTQVRNLKVSGIVSTMVTISWDPPDKLNGLFTGYEAVLQLIGMMGCIDAGLDTPKIVATQIVTPSTSRTFYNLHPYATYIVTVVARTSKRGKEESARFDTPPSDLPTEKFENLRLEGNALRWDLPKACENITGSIIMKRLILTGVSEFTKNISETRQTKNDYFFLSTFKHKFYPAEKYKVQIFVIRAFGEPHNPTAVEEIEFVTPAKPPPPVSKLEVIEVDTRTRTMTLRWQPPALPHNGKLNYYSVSYCNSWYCSWKTNVSAEQRCEFWSDYVCTTVQQPSEKFKNIAVSGYNVNVTEPGKSRIVEDIRWEKEPEKPSKLNVVPIERGVLYLSWPHPFRTGGRLKNFHIDVEMIKTDLRNGTRRKLEESPFFEQAIDIYKVQYDETLYLLTSTTYSVSVRAVTIGKIIGEKITVTVQTETAIGFEGALSAIVSDQDSTILLSIPRVANDTNTSTMHVIVKGPHPCERVLKVNEKLRSYANINYDDTAWVAGIFPTDKYAYNVFTVGDKLVYQSATNCELKPHELYEIVVVVQSKPGSMDNQMIVAKTESIRIGEAPRRNDEAWLIPTVLLLIVVVAAVYFYRRRRAKGHFKETHLQDEMPLSQNGNQNGGNVRNTMNSKQVHTTATISDKETLSRGSTPDIGLVAVDVDHGEKRTSLVKVKDFEDYVRQAIGSGVLDKQYETFPRGQTQPWEYGKLPQNKWKNRYGNLVAYDDTRVILKKHPDDPYSDYINANYISGYKKVRSYIATQGPKPTTVIDFWRMIWQENVLIICMVANVIENGKTKCEQYWPDIGKKKKYGDVIVLNAKHNVFAEYTLRTLHATHGDITRKVEHLHYTAWPDHGVPLYTHSVVTYLKKLLATPAGSGPIVVHCSAGVGRTGTIILCDVCLRRAAAEGVVDVFAETESIRNQRANMVDNKQQYLLAHLALVECLLSLPTALPCNDVLPAKIKELKSQLEPQRQRLQDTAWQDEALRPPTTQTTLSERNLAKNRFPELVSEKVSRLFIKRYPVTDEESDYIAGVYVDGVKVQNQFLASQLPMPSTVSDFWRMIAELRVELIVMLQPPDLQDPTCCAVAPKNGEFKPTPFLNVVTKDIMEMEYYTSQKLILIDNSEKPAREQSITILCSTEWEPGRDRRPAPVISLVTVWQAAERISRGDGPMVTLCHDGVTGCGLYLALSFLLERMAVERECDVCLSIRAVRRSRPDFVQSLEQMEYLYDAALTYLEYFETYANFS